MTAWDEQISGHVGCDRTAAGFAAHLEKCRAWAGGIVGEAAAEGVTESEIGMLVGRPESSVAKLIDEYLDLTITRRER